MGAAILADAPSAVPAGSSRLPSPPARISREGSPRRPESIGGSRGRSSRPGAAGRGRTGSSDGPSSGLELPSALDQPGHLDYPARDGIGGSARAREIRHDLVARPRFDPHDESFAAPALDSDRGPPVALRHLVLTIAGRSIRGQCRCPSAGRLLKNESGRRVASLAVRSHYRPGPFFSQKSGGSVSAGRSRTPPVRPRVKARPSALCRRPGRGGR